MNEEPTEEQKRAIDRQIEDAVLIGDLRTENAKLKAENEELKKFNITYQLEENQKLQQENESLRQLKQNIENYINEQDKFHKEWEELCDRQHSCGYCNYGRKHLKQFLNGEPLS